MSHTDDSRGEIGAKNVLQTLGDFLKMNSPKRAPAHLNTDIVQPTIDIAALAGRATPTSYGTPFVQTVNTLPATASEYFANIIWDGALGEKIAGVNAYRIDTMDVEVVFDAAGALAFNGKRMALEVLLGNMGGDPPVNYRCVTLWPWAQVKTDAIANGRIYRWVLGGNSVAQEQSAATAPNVMYSTAGTWRGEVPVISVPFGGGFLGLRVRLTSWDGTAFPAATTFRVWVTGRESANSIPPSL